MCDGRVAWGTKQSQTRQSSGCKTLASKLRQARLLEQPAQRTAYLVQSRAKVASLRCNPHFTGPLSTVPALAQTNSMGLTGYICFMTALSVAAALLYTPSQRLLECVHCPKYFVVRRVDYLHYRIERAHYLLRFVASSFTVRVVRGAEPFAGLVSLVGAATVLNLCMEVGLRVTGQRQMRLRAYSRLPSALAVLVQAFFEGGMRQRGCAFSSVPAATPSPRLTKRAKLRRLLWHVLRLCAACERGR